MCQRDVLSNERLQPGDPVTPYYEPELQRTEAPAELYSPIAKVDHLRIGLGAQVFRRHLESSEERRGVSHEVGAAVEVYQHPLMRVHDETVGMLESVKQVPELGQNCRTACIGGIDVKPCPMFATHLGDAVDRVDRRGRGRADRRHHTRRYRSSLDVA